MAEVRLRFYRLRFFFFVANFLDFDIFGRCMCLNGLA